MIRNIKLILEYDGTNFHGWQIQEKNRRTIQGEIEKALKKIFKRPIRLIGSGRTDSGVHAVGQIANFKLPLGVQNFELLRDHSKILKALNANLPEDIAIIDAVEARPDFHAQFDAKRKLYRYTILNGTDRSAVLRDFCYFYPYRLNLALMRREAKVLLGQHNFKSFQAADPAVKGEKSTIRTITKLSIKKTGDFILIDIEANGFLYKMVRNIIGTLLDIGRGRLKERSMKKILKQKNRALAGTTAPAKGLCLVKVNY